MKTYTPTEAIKELGMFDKLIAVEDLKKLKIELELGCGRTERDYAWTTDLCCKGNLCIICETKVNLLKAIEDKQQ